MPVSSPASSSLHRGRLLKPEHFSGFGISPGPGLTLVHGGEKKKPAKKQAREAEPREEPPPRETATSRRHARAAEKARTAFDEAEQRLDVADTAEKNVQEQVRTLTSELAELQKELEDAKRAQDVARKEARTARTKRREALSALDRAERQLSD